MKFKRQLWRASVMTGVVFFLTAFFMPVVYSPRADASTPFYANYQPTEGWNGFVKAVHTVAPMYNFPENVVLAQGALESQRGNSEFAKERNNYLGIGAYDSNPDEAFTYETIEQCVIAYMQTIKKNFPEAWDQRENPDKLIEKLEKNSRGNMYATDPDYVAKIKSMKEWK